MKVHKITLIVVDHDKLGINGVIAALTNARYPNHCISPEIVSSVTADCGKWSDAHPLNNHTTSEAELTRLFGSNL